MQNRFHSWALWVAVAALAVDLAVYGGVINVSQSEQIEGLAQRFLELLVLAGIINNPTDPSRI